jgi:hypothetical protein
VGCCIHAALTLWYLGYPDQGLARSNETVTLAQQVAHPFSLGLAWAALVWCHQSRREGRAAQECAEAALVLATEQGFPFWRAFHSVLHGWALAHQGQAREGIEQMRQGLVAYRATGAETMRSYFLVLLAEVYGTIGQPEAGLTVLWFVFVGTSPWRGEARWPTPIEACALSIVILLGIMLLLSALRSPLDA